MGWFEDLRRRRKKPRPPKDAGAEKSLQPKPGDVAGPSPEELEARRRKRLHVRREDASEVENLLGGLFAEPEEAAAASSPPPSPPSPPPAADEESQITSAQERNEALDSWAREAENFFAKMEAALGPARPAAEPAPEAAPEPAGTSAGPPAASAAPSVEEDLEAVRSGELGRRLLALGTGRATGALTFAAEDTSVSLAALLARSTRAPSRGRLVFEPEPATRAAAAVPARDGTSEPPPAPPPPAPPPPAPPGAGPAEPEPEAGPEPAASAPAEEEMRYSLEDLPEPSFPGPGPEIPERAGRAEDEDTDMLSEAALPGEDLLAAFAGEPAEPDAPEAPTPSLKKPAAGSASELAPAEERRYRMEDLPTAEFLAVPAASSRRSAQGQPEPPEEVLAETSLPDARLLDAAPAEALPSEPTAGKEAAAREAGKAAGLSEVLQTDARRRAEHLSAEKLAAVEQMLERQIEGERPPEAPVPLLVRAVRVPGRIERAWASFRRNVADVFRRGDRVLGRARLSWRTVLGIAGILLLAAEMPFLLRRLGVF